MHDNAFACRKIAHDSIARNRMTAVAETQHAAFGAGDQDLLGVLCSGYSRTFVVQLQQRSRDLVSGAIAQGDIGEKIFQSAQLVVFEIAVELLGGQHFQ